MKKYIKFEEIFLHLNNPSLSVRESLIHGVGLFTSARLDVGTSLGPMCFHQSLFETYKYFLAAPYDNKLNPKFIQTTAARYINHSTDPNTEFYLVDETPDIIYLSAIKDIAEDEEVTVNYIVLYQFLGIKELPDFLIPLQEDIKDEK